MRYASGKRAWARCQRCGDRKRYGEIVLDGDNKNLQVCKPCYDISHPAEKPFNPIEGIILKRPSPDIDDDSAGTLSDATGTARAGTSTTIQLATTASEFDDVYVNYTITLTGGTGSGQSKTILDYVGSTRMVHVSTWATTPDATTTYSIDVTTLAVRLGFDTYFGGAT